MGPPQDFILSGCRFLGIRWEPVWYALGTGLGFRWDRMLLVCQTGASAGPEASIVEPPERMAKFFGKFDAEMQLNGKVKGEIMMLVDGVGMSQGCLRRAGGGPERRGSSLTKANLAKMKRASTTGARRGSAINA